MTTKAGQLSERQRELLGEWLPGVEVVRDHSWGLVGTTVLEVVQGGERFGVKAGDARDQHLAREIRAHGRWLGVWVSAGRAPEMVHAEAQAKLLVTRSRCPGCGTRSPAGPPRPLLWSRLMVTGSRATGWCTRVWSASLTSVGAMFGRR